MEWSLPVNQILRDEITKVPHTLIPPGFKGDAHNFRAMQDSLSRIVNAMGAQSAAEQELNKVITTADKLRNSPSHELYLLKDPEANGGKGEVIGLLKVGRKRLFLFDERETVHEVEPLCVLDFFVAPARQRQGAGKRLFDHMLQDQKACVEQLAIDGPSAKMERFLRKNYAVERLVQQYNNFAFVPRFFDTNKDIKVSGGAGGGACAALAPSVGRFTAPKPHSDIATVIHGSCGDGQHFAGANSGESSRAPSPSPSPGAGGDLLAAGFCEGRRDSQLTGRGHFNIKYYHSRLW